jgi:beta-galactosidase/beta-glucuronidase
VTKRKTKTDKIHNKNLFSIFTENAKVQVEVVDANGVVVAIGDGVKGQVGVQNVKLWWPYSMVKTGAAYMYTLKVNIENKFLLCILSVHFSIL